MGCNNRPAYNCDELFPKKLGEFWGYMDSTGRWAIPPNSFYYASPFENGYATVREESGSYLINCKGEKVLPDFNKTKTGNINNRILVGIERRVGFVDITGKRITPIWENAEPYSCGLSLVRQGEVCGFMDTTGNMAIPLKYSSAKSFNPNGRAIVNRGNSYGIIDTKGNEIVPISYSYIEYRPAHNLYLARNNNWQWGFLSENGNIEVPFSDYSPWDDFYGNIIIVSNKEKKHYIMNRLGQIISGEYDYIRFLPDDNYPIPVRKNGVMGFLDFSGKEVIPLVYEMTDYFFEDRALIKKNGKYGYLDSSGREIIPPQFDDAKRYVSSFARVQKDTLYGFINRDGENLTDFIYSKLENFNEGLAAVKKGDKWGFIDKTGAIAITCKYDNVLPFEHGTAKVYLNGYEFYINKKGECVTEKVEEYIEEFFVPMTRT